MVAMSEQVRERRRQLDRVLGIRDGSTKLDRALKAFLRASSYVFSLSLVAVLARRLHRDEYRPVSMASSELMVAHFPYYWEMPSDGSGRSEGPVWQAATSA